MNLEFERVEITYFKNPHAFWINRLEDEDLEYKKFYQDLQTYCAAAHRCAVRIGMIYGVKDPTLNMWVRAEFDREIDVSLANKLHSNSGSYKVWLVDEGRPAEITLPARKLSSAFREKGSKCERAMLFGVTPATCQINHSTGQFEKEKTKNWNANAAALINKLLDREGNEVWFRQRKKLENCVVGDLIFKNKTDGNVNAATYLSEKQVAYLDEDNLKENDIIMRLPNDCRLATPIQKELEPKSPIQKNLVSKSVDLPPKSDTHRQRIRALTTRNVHLKTEDAISRVKSSAVLTRTMGRGSRRSINTSSDSESIHNDSNPKPPKPLNQSATKSSDSTSESIQSDSKPPKQSVKSETNEVAVLDLNKPFIEDDAVFLQRMAQKALLKKQQQQECKVEPVKIKTESSTMQIKAGGHNAIFLKRNIPKEEVEELGSKLTENKIVPQRKTKAGLLMKKLKIKPKKSDDDTFFTAEESMDTTASESSNDMSSSSLKDGLTSDISDSSDLKSGKENSFAWPVIQSKSRKKQPLMIPAGLPPTSDHYKKLIENHEENKLEKAAVRKHNQTKECSSNNSEDSSSDDLLKNNVRTLQEGRNIKSGSGMSVLYV